MQCKKLDSSSYKKLIQSYPEKQWPIEQSAVWGEFQSRIPGREFVGMFLLSEEDNPAVFVSILQLHMHGYSYAWINQGPVWLQKPTQALANDVVKALRKIVREHCTKQPLFIRAHFPLPAKNAIAAHSKSLVEKTTIVDLTKPFDELLAAMNYGARRGMRQAQKAGITIHEVPREEAIAHFNDYYIILRETTTRGGFFGHPEQTYKTMLESLGAHARLFAAFNEQGKPIAWALDTVYENHAIYYYGASNEAARKVSAPYLMQIEIMRQLQSEGVKSYDFLGIGSKNYPGLQGVTQFKLRFGGDVVEYTPIYDIPINTLKYKLWVQAQKAKYTLRKFR